MHGWIKTKYFEWLTKKALKDLRNVSRSRRLLWLTWEISKLMSSGDFNMATNYGENRGAVSKWDANLEDMQNEFEEIVNKARLT